MGDAEFLRLAAEEAEFKRVKERLTLKHKNTSQWARRALRRGINVMDEGALPSSSSTALSKIQVSLPVPVGTGSGGCLSPARLRGQCLAPVWRVLAG